LIRPPCPLLPLLLLALLRYIPHKVLIAADGTVIKNYDFKGSSLAAEVEKLK
jgi:hypothetical protein